MSVTVLAEQAVVLCQVEKAKEDMLNQLYSSIRLATYQSLGDILMILFRMYGCIIFFPNSVMKVF